MREKILGRRSWGVLVSAATYIVALVAAVFVVRAAGLGHPLADLGLGTVVATLVVFAVSVLVDNSSIYDPYWSVQPLAIVGYYLWTAWGAAAGPSGTTGGVGVRQIIVTALVFLYALRLTSNFYRDWPGLAKEDFRYVAFRERYGRLYWPVSLLGIHLFPTVMVYLGCLPLYGLVRTGATGLGWLDGLAFAVTLVAIALAFVADEQMRAFRRDPRNRGFVMQSGLWAHSRHPNYLGEVSTWWGLWLFALAAGVEWWWTVVGAAAITALFVFVSIPMMERRVPATRHGYAEYRERTPMLMLRP